MQQIYLKPWRTSEPNVKLSPFQIQSKKLCSQKLDQKQVICLEEGESYPQLEASFE